MAVDIYNKYCEENGFPVFPVTPLFLHRCSPACDFFLAAVKTYVCTRSRQVHVCCERCPFATSNEAFICTLTNRRIGARLDYRSFDGTTTLSRIRVSGRNPILPPHLRHSIIINNIISVLSGPFRAAAEETCNQRDARTQLVVITKLARNKKMHRGNWLSYYTLFLANSKRKNRPCASLANIKTLALAIDRFWDMLYKVAPITRTLTVFTGVCIAELANSSNPVFPQIPWLHATAPTRSNMYNLCIGITCRSMTAQLMEIYDLAHKNSVIFPVDVV